MSAAAAASVAAERQRLTLELEAEQQRRSDMAASMRGLLEALRPQASASPPAEAPCDPEIRDVAELLRQLKTVADRTEAGASGQPQKKKPQRKKRAKAASRSPAAQTPPSAKPRRRPASAAPSRSKGGPRAQQRRASLPTRRPPLMSPSPSPSPSRRLSGSRSASRRAAAAAETQRQSAAAFDKSVSAHKRHTHARHAGMVRCTARTPSSGALPAPHPSRPGSGRAAVHRISRGQSVVVTPLDPAR